MRQEPMGIAIVGCGYVADSYRYCLQLHGGALRLTGVYDRDSERLSAFSGYWKDAAYPSLDALLADPACRIVLNLTDPHNHAAVTRAALAAGKHVYSEKPLGLSAQEAQELAGLAERAGLRLAGAPCNFLGESVQTAWAAVRAGAIGRVRLVYAELDDGMVHRADYTNWISRSGRAWPARGEFETGCTYEHAGYALGALIAMFGPVRQVSAYSTLLIADKKTRPPLENPAPDFSTGCLEFDGGIVARVTNSIVAPYDHRFRIVGEEGVIDIAEIWDYGSSVILRRAATGRLGRLIERRWPQLSGRRLKPVRAPLLKRGPGRPTMDFMRGVAELASAIYEDRPCKLDAALAMHITEVTEMLQHPDRFAQPSPVASSCKPIEPEAWATGR
ncbi:Gfo/Idh/MocA family oxidoreductase [Rhizobium sp. YJ-22]|uniref:Gfo/Idh/MocA family protein n=1 Tax=Rhizobium sp. YJ-22 TaxID=3037556 RepID=UPI002412D643|nr:Gfo/Idh/MocA family oxidoreductase [Rhizobium sp. YJ-22]MDG3577928.1 Gfo/Idh/MocA family oxidoreductase [Rhizobium sp. YJ-22]